MLQNEYTLSTQLWFQKIGFDTAENEPSKIWVLSPTPETIMDQMNTYEDVEIRVHRRGRLLTSCQRQAHVSVIPHAVGGQGTEDRIADLVLAGNVPEAARLGRVEEALHMTLELEHLAVVHPNLRDWLMRLACCLSTEAKFGMLPNFDETLPEFCQKLTKSSGI